MADPQSLTPFATTQRPDRMTGAEMGYMRALRVIDNPRLAIQAVKDGTLSVDEADAIKNVYPSMYAQMQTAIMASIGTRTPGMGPLPYGVATRLGILFDLPTDGTMRPEFIGAMQATNAPEQKEPDAQRGPSSKAGNGKTGVPQTPLEHIETHV